MTKNITEEELLLRKRARRRLVGAIVLVLVSIIVLPAIFDEPKPDNEMHEIAINLPGVNKSAIVPSTEQMIRETFNELDATTELQNEPEIYTQNIEEIIESPTSGKRSIPIPGIKPKFDNRPAAILSTNNVNSAHTAINTQTAATTNATETEKIPADLAKGFVIQLGAFSDQLKAKQQHANLISNGFKAYTETLQTGTNEVTRVRVGPFATRGAADNEMKKLKRIGLDGVIIPR
ncbi:SPOR domain-containing protein [Nitrosomonas supralitoralis]|uniref:SPOR domain-containing protein n=1 Tax=Nitrosomonas supralitoralis TaxID=2116706 RepID=A0A2P7NWN1_9PROT|nr:SPOR domain-containing protein [Nitrosomonas supralitoralis]PSJ17873.1 SPOR domain-containing protein [Nitrosomonas supralitoralis]